MERKLWELLCANVLILALIILAGIVSGWGEALAWLGGLLIIDWLIVKRWRDGGDGHPGEGRKQAAGPSPSSAAGRRRGPDSHSAKLEAVRDMLGHANMIVDRMTENPAEYLEKLLSG